MKQKLTIPYFPTGLRYLSPVPAVGGLYLMLEHHLVWGLVLLILSIILVTTQYVTAIDLRKKECHDYLMLLGIELNEERQHFTQLDRIVITKGNYAQTINTRSQSRQLDWSDFTGTLLHDQGQLDLLTRNSKEDLLKALKELSLSLQVPVEDRTSTKHYLIDIDTI